MKFHGRTITAVTNSAQTDNFGVFFFFLNICVFISDVIQLTDENLNYYSHFNCRLPRAMAVFGKFIIVDNVISVQKSAKFSGISENVCI